MKWLVGWLDGLQRESANNVTMQVPGTQLLTPAAQIPPRKKTERKTFCNAPSYSLLDNNTNNNKQSTLDVC